MINRAEHLGVHGVLLLRNIWGQNPEKTEAKHCSSLCSQSEGGEYCGGQARAENSTKSCPRALVMFATCSWPSLCEQSELQCWRRNRRLCGPVQISAARTLPLTFDIPILNTLPFRGAVASLPTSVFDFKRPPLTPKSPLPCPILVSESGSRRIRIWEQTRPNLGADALAAGSRDADKHRERKRRGVVNCAHP